MEYIMYAFLAMVLLMLLWALRLWYRMHQEETVYAVYKKSDYIFCAAFLLLGILNLYDESMAAVWEHPDGTWYSVWNEKKRHLTA